MPIRYIKLGERGCWEADCIQQGTLRLGYEGPHHMDALEGNWDAVREFWLQHYNGHQATATSAVRQIRAFYEAPEQDLWVTFYQGRLWWCHAGAEVTELEDGTKIRTAIGGWRSENEAGEPLAIANLDGRVTQVQNYRGTICETQQQEYLLRRIRGEVLPEIDAIRTTLDRLESDIETLVRGLWWKDFWFRELKESSSQDSRYRTTGWE